MPEMKRADMRIIDDAFRMGSGYVLHFDSNRRFAEYFEDEFQLDIEDKKYCVEGESNSKARRLRAFITLEDAVVVSYVLRKLWEKRIEHLPPDADPPQEAAITEKFFGVISRLEGDNNVSRTDALERFKKDHTLDELVLAIERDITAHKSAAALDRLHTYCMKKVTHLLELRGETCVKEEPLHSRFGRYVKALESERDLRDMSRLIVKSSISVFEKFNHVRNDRTFAHDNDILDEAEARFIFEGVSAFLRFVKTVDARSFGA
jgi:hypothetical protein